MHRMIGILLFITLLAIFPGCWDQKIYEQMGLILQVGMERDQNGDLIYTATLPVVSAENKNEFEILHSKANLLRKGRENARLTSGKTVEGGKTQQLLFSDELAAEGIHEFLEIFHRAAENPLLPHVVVVEGNPSAIMEASREFKEKPRPAIYLNQLLTNAYKNAYTPETRIYRFDIDYYSIGIDPITARIRLGSDGIEVCGSALFSEDKMVGRLDTRQTSLLLAMMNSTKSFEYVDESGNYPDKAKNSKPGAAVGFKVKNRKVSVSLDNAKPVIKIALELQADIREFQYDAHFDERGVELQLEKFLSDSLKKQCNDILKYMQSVKSDPIGVGELIRTKYPTLWKPEEWKNLYGNTKISAEVNVDKVHYGTLF